MNIGTFKAFGLDNNTLKVIYLQLLIPFIFLCIIVALSLSYVFGILGGIRFILNCLNITLEQGQHYFRLNNIWTYISIIIVMISSFFILIRTANSILTQTPGDLVNDRLSKSL